MYQRVYTVLSYGMNMGGSRRLGRAIYDRRMALGQSREQVGAIVGGVSKTTVGRWEDAVTLPSFDHARALADWLGVNIEHVTALMRGEDPAGMRDADLRVIVQQIAAQQVEMRELLARLTSELLDLEARYGRMADAALASIRKRPPRRPGS